MHSHLNYVCLLFLFLKNRITLLFIIISNVKNWQNNYNDNNCKFVQIIINKRTIAELQKAHSVDTNEYTSSFETLVQKMEKMEIERDEKEKERDKLQFEMGSAKLTIEGQNVVIRLLKEEREQLSRVNATLQETLMKERQEKEEVKRENEGWKEMKLKLEGELKRMEEKCKDLEEMEEDIKTALRTKERIAARLEQIEKIEKVEKKEIKEEGKNDK